MMEKLVFQLRKLKTVHVDNIRVNQVIKTSAKAEDFEKKLSNFLKDSEDKLTSIKRQTESRRGGKGSRR